MPHMIPQIEHMSAYHVETNCGTECVPAELVGSNATIESLRNYLEGTPRADTDLDFVTGWFARLSAPGYMDCTEWSGPYETEQEAKDALSEMFDIDADTGEELND